jgi:hypothetical protein
MGYLLVNEKKQHQYENVLSRLNDKHILINWIDLYTMPSMKKKVITNHFWLIINYSLCGLLVNEKNPSIWKCSRDELIQLEMAVTKLTCTFS